MRRKGLSHGCGRVLIVWLLRQEAFGLLIAEGNLVDGVSAVLERDVIAVDIRR